MSVSIPVSYQPKKPFHYRNGSDELDVFEAARYFSGAAENFSGTHENTSVEARNFSNNTRPFGRMSLDMQNHKGVPLQAMLIENRMVINKEIKKSKQPSSPGGKLAHFLNSLFNQTSSKSKSKSKTKDDQDESHSGNWRRKRRSSISHFRSETTTTNASPNATIMSDAKSPFSTSESSGGFRTPPSYIAHTPTKTKSYSYLKPLPTQITKIPINGNINKIETFSIKNDLSEKTMSFGNGFLEKVKIYDEKQEEHQPHMYSYLKPLPTQITKIPINGNLNKIETFSIKNDFSEKTMSFRNGFLEKVKIYDEKQEDIKEFKRFIVDDDGADSDSSSDLFELTNCDLGYHSSGLPVYETTRMESIKRGAPISS